MKIKITPGKLSGNLEAIPSKSQAHRVLIASALSDLRGNGAASYPVAPGSSKDIDATAGCVEEIKRAAKAGESASLDCGESGTTLRFLLPVCAALGLDAEYFGSGRLPERPLSPLKEEMERHGVTFGMPESTLDEAHESEHRSEPEKKSSRLLPICASRGKLKGGDFSLAGNVSSQFISGLLFALPLTSDGGAIIITERLESAHYIEMTLDVIRKFGIEIKVKKNGPDWSGTVFIVPGGQEYKAPASVKVDGDWSNAAFWLAADSLGSDIGISGLDLDSPQGDTAILDIIRDLDCSDVIDAKDIPDLVPIISVLAAVKPGTRTITNAERLRIKESDRLEAMAADLRVLGVDLDEHEGGLTIRGGRGLLGGPVHGYNDHRVVMAMAIAATAADAPIIIDGAEAAAKSYPAFFRDFRRLGGVIEEVE